jgi:DNA-binding CsgD family transcriptional regulator
VTGVSRLSDYWDRRAKERSVLYNELYRNVEAVHQLNGFFRHANGQFHSINFVRGGMDFTRREKDILKMLIPLFRAHYRRLSRIEHLRAELQAQRIGRQIIPIAWYRLDHADNIRDASPASFEQLRRWYPNHDIHYRLPEQLLSRVRFMRETGSTLTTADFGKELLAGLRRSPGFELLTLGMARDEPAEILCAISSREREVLERVRSGASNTASGLQLGISPRTVEKHLESIYRKTGVENRYAAIRLFR